MKFLSEYSHHLTVRMAVSDLPCDPNDINAWSTVTVKLERETNSVILEDLDHYGTSPERDYAPTDVVNLNFTFSIYDIRNPEAEIDRHIVQVYEAMRNLGFRMPDVGGPSRIDFANPRGEVIDFDLVPILPLGKLQKLTQRGDGELLVQLLTETPWYQDVIGNIYVSPSKISNYDAQQVVAIDQEVDIRVFEDHRYASANRSPEILSRERILRGWIVLGRNDAPLRHPGRLWCRAVQHEAERG